MTSEQDLVSKLDVTRIFWWLLTEPNFEKAHSALKKVDRADFLPAYNKKNAHKDVPLCIGWKATCTCPSLVALMAHMLDIKEGMNILEIGTGCGYSAAVTYHLMGTGKLTTIEIIHQLAKRGKRNLEKHFGSLEGKIEIVIGDGSVGYHPNAPYDRIYLTAAANVQTFNIQILIEQLAEEGILLFPEQPYKERPFGGLHTYIKTGPKIEEKYRSGVCFVPLQGKNR